MSISKQKIFDGLTFVFTLGASHLIQNVINHGALEGYSASIAGDYFFELSQRINLKKPMDEADCASTLKRLFEFYECEHMPKNFRRMSIDYVEKTVNYMTSQSLMRIEYLENVTEKMRDAALEAKASDTEVAVRGMIAFWNACDNKPGLAMPQRLQTQLARIADELAESDPDLAQKIKNKFITPALATPQPDWFQHIAMN